MEQNAIKQVIEKAYIMGIHKNQDAAAVKSGFHPDFTMLVLQDNAINKVMLDPWLANIEKSKAENPAAWNAETTYDLALLDVTGNAAIAKIEVYKDGKHVFTDYMALYKFEEGWKIVNKIFTRHN